MSNPKTSQSSKPNTTTFSWLGMSPITPANNALFVSLIVCAVAFDWGIRSFNAVGGAIFFIVTSVALLLTGRFKRPESRIALALAPVFGVWLAIRSSPWLLPFDVVAALFLLGVAASFATGESMFRITVPRLMIRTLALVGHFFAAPAFVIKPLVNRLPQRWSHARSVIAGLLMIAPVFLVLTWLLASADSVFASFFDFEINVGNATSHIALITTGCWFTAALLRAASAEQPSNPPLFSWRLGATEATVALGAIVVLYVAFTFTQLVIWAGGAQRALESTGHTYAAHARNGFFQLLAVGIITLLVLTIMRASIRLDTTKQRYLWIWFAEIVIALTLVIVGVAVHRLGMYEDAYGLTMLRLYSTVFAFWMGVVFVLLGYSITKLHNNEHRNENWFVSSVIATGLIVLFGLNILNPEQFVVQRNVSRLSTSSIPLDSNYITLLSEDSIPTALKALPKLNNVAHENMVGVLCHNFDDKNHSNEGLANFNLSRSQSNDIRQKRCPGELMKYQ